MNLKNNISIKVISIVLASIVVAFTSCSNEDLEVTSPNDSSVEEIRENNNGLNLVLIGAYDAYQKIPISEHILTELRSDNGRANTLNGLFPSIDAYQIQTNLGEAANYWSNNFITIAQTNIILGGELNEVNRSVFGEAYFLRALCYFNLVRAYDNVPYIDRFLTERSQIFEFPQLEPTAMYANIVADFQRAIELLTGIDQPRNRASEGAAKILLAKTYLSQPSPNYGAARDLLAEFVLENNAFGYNLITGVTDPNTGINDSYSKVFARSNELNNEIIFAISYETSGSPDFITSDADLEDQIQSDAESFSFSMSVSGPSNGVNIATNDLKRFVDSRKAPVITVNPETMVATVTQVPEPNRANVIFTETTINREDTENGKWISSNIRQRAGDVDWIVLRYSDALLLYVEAILGVANETNDVRAVAAYDRVRVRAGFPTLADDDTIVDKVITKQALLDERRAEFAFENQRFYDLVRFGEAIPVLTAHGLQEDPNNPFNFTPRDLLLPIPQREVDATNNFYDQNLGYN